MEPRGPTRASEQHLPSGGSTHLKHQTRQTGDSHTEECLGLASDCAQQIDECFCGRLWEQTSPYIYDTQVSHGKRSVLFFSQFCVSDSRRRVRFHSLPYLRWSDLLYLSNRWLTTRRVSLQSESTFTANTDSIAGATAILALVAFSPS